MAGVMFSENRIIIQNTYLSIKQGGYTYAYKNFSACCKTKDIVLSKL